MAKKAKSKKAAKKPARKARASRARSKGPARKAASRKAARRMAPKAGAKKKTGRRTTAKSKPSASKNRMAAPKVDRRNEGEGSKSADKAYRDAATRFTVTHDTAALAEQAAREVEASPHEYDDAENEGLSRSAGDLPQDEN
jgi:hypothetical protein